MFYIWPLELRDKPTVSVLGQIWFHHFSSTFITLSVIPFGPAAAWGNEKKFFLRSGSGPVLLMMTEKSVTHLFSTGSEH